VSGNPILRVATKVMVPFMLVFGLYIICHGDLSPGGGFQGGVAIASGFIFYGMVFGKPAMQKLLPRAVSDALIAIGVLLYAGTGMYCLLAGYRFLDYTPLEPSNPGGAEAWGMTLVEYGVGFTVSMVMVTCYNEITEGTLPGETPDKPGEAAK
jgi:multicomponent Na+:H+ antiporter subunit B